MQCSMGSAQATLPFRRVMRMGLWSGRVWWRCAGVRVVPDGRVGRYAGFRNVTARVRDGVARDGGRLRVARRRAGRKSSGDGKERDAYAVDLDPAEGIVVLCLVSLSYAAPGGVVSAVLARREVDGKQQRERSLVSTSNDDCGRVAWSGLRVGMGLAQGAVTPRDLCVRAAA